MSVEHNKNERRRILELSSPQSSGRTKMKVQLTPLRKIRSKLTSKLNNRGYEENNLSDVEIVQIEQLVFQVVMTSTPSPYFKTSHFLYITI